MAKNANLIRASKVKHDEFYTQIADIEREMKHYTKEKTGLELQAEFDAMWYA